MLEGYTGDPYSDRIASDERELDPDQDRGHEVEQG